MSPAPTIPGGRAALRGKTAPLLLAERSRATPDVVAYRAKHLGLYRERTWRDYGALVGRCLEALASLGFERGERVAIMGDPCEEWMILDLAAQALGGISYGIYPTASAPEIEFQMRDGGACLFVAENQEYVDKILPLADRLPSLKWIVVIDDSAMFAYENARLRPFDALMERAALSDDAALAALEARAGHLDPEAPAFIVYTSGTTGNPKGALSTHGMHLASTYTVVEHYPLLDEKDQRTVVFLPLCHVFGRDVAITLPLLSRLVPHFGEDIEDLSQTLFEVAPTVLFTVPRYMQKFASTVLVAMANTFGIKRAVYDAAVRYGRSYVRRLWDGSVSAAQTTVYRVLHSLAFRPILNKIGFDQLEMVLSGGAPLPTETTALWHIYGVNLLEAYGQTENAGAFISGQPGPFPRPGNVGTICEGLEVRLGPEGEILVRGETRDMGVFKEYWGNPEATRAAVDAEGWLHTGDAGEWVEGKRLRIVDRVRDFLVTSGGKTIAPSYIENILRASPYVADVIVFGHARKYLTALVEIDFDIVSEWARGNNIAYTGYTSLARHPEVLRLLREEIARANAQLGRVEQVKDIRVLPKALDPEEEGEPVTPTRKVKRRQMYERFRDLVESMYDETEARLVASEAGDVLQK